MFLAWFASCCLLILIDTGFQGEGKTRYFPRWGCQGGNNSSLLLVGLPFWIKIKLLTSLVLNLGGRGQWWGVTSGFIWSFRMSLFEIFINFQTWGRENWKLQFCVCVCFLVIVHQRATCWLSRRNASLRSDWKENGGKTNCNTSKQIELIIWWDDMWFCPLNLLLTFIF